MAAVAHNGTRFQIHHDETLSEDSTIEGEEQIETGETTESEENEDQETDQSEDEEADPPRRRVKPSVLEDMHRFQRSVPGMAKRYRLIDRIGEGTFSTVYKAEDLEYDFHENDWDIEEKENTRWASPPSRKHHTEQTGPARPRRRAHYVAIKKIYVTSSPSRIHNEIELLSALNGCPSVCPLITAFRAQDQVVAVLPYFQHTDFRHYFRDMTTADMRIYFHSLFTALAAVHEQGILHRDVKPTNFLYEPVRRRGVLVDFGLAEREVVEGKPCLCTVARDKRRRRLENSIAVQMGPSTGYPRQDTRPSRRANRAGTRGFRAPEVLFKCTCQTPAIDVWSAGVVLLTILSRRFPFFNSTDDVEAMIEMATLFGLKQMKQCALLHGAVLETNIDTIGNSGFRLEKIILWSTSRLDEKGSSSASASAAAGTAAGAPAAAGPHREGEGPLSEDEKLAVRFLEECLRLDAPGRITAAEALEHPFLKQAAQQEQDCTEDEMDVL